MVSPTQVGVDLKEKNGDESALEMRRPKDQSQPESPSVPEDPNVKEPGRPKNSRDIEKRKTKEFKPKNKASVELWAKGAQDKVADILNPGILKQFNKKNMRSLNDWKENFELVPEKFKKTKNLKRSGMAGLFSASLELTKEGLINIMQKKNFGKILIKER